MDVSGKSVIRKDALEKVTGRAIYTNDLHSVKILSGSKVINPYGHAKIVSIDSKETWKVPGALGNALSHAAVVSFHLFPLIPELIWRAKEASR